MSPNATANPTEAPTSQRTTSGGPAHHEHDIGAEERVAEPHDLEPGQHRPELLGRVLVVERLVVGARAREEPQPPDRRARWRRADEDAARPEDPPDLGDRPGGVGHM